MTPFDLVYDGHLVRFMGRRFPAICGRGGVTDHKCEGDGATPRGVHGIVDLYYRSDRLAPPAAHAIPIRLGDLWCDDPSQPSYNQLVKSPCHASHEVLRRSDPQYDIFLTTTWNWPKAQPGKGSAIFIHQWRRPGAPTAGCIGFSRQDLRWIAARLRPNSRLIIR